MEFHFLGGSAVADLNGNWEWSSVEHLPENDYNINVVSLDPQGLSVATNSLLKIENELSQTGQNVLNTSVMWLILIILDTILLARLQRKIIT